MRESRTYGSGRGARGNSRPYREVTWPSVDAICCTARVRLWHEAAVPASDAGSPQFKVKQPYDGAAK
jgi:hypothetical protein